jgi:hypothetical protein
MYGMTLDSSNKKEIPDEEKTELKYLIKLYYEDLIRKQY